MHIVLLSHKRHDTVAEPTGVESRPANARTHPSSSTPSRGTLKAWKQRLNIQRQSTYPADVLDDEAPLEQRLIESASVTKRICAAAGQRVAQQHNGRIRSPFWPCPVLPEAPAYTDSMPNEKLEGLNPPCSHLSAIHSVKHPKRLECDECVKIGSTWVQLRTCQECGTTLCCDNSPNRHARKHAGDSGHPVIASAQPGERVLYCFADNAGMEY